MSTPKLDYSSFDRLAGQLDLVFISFWLNQRPAGVANEWMVRIKNGGRMLARASGLQRSKALECMAEALHFPNWHTLHSHLDQANALQPKTVPSAWIERLRFGLVLLTDPEPDVALSPAQVLAFEDLAARLSAGAGTPVDIVLDKVCAGFCGATSWAEVKIRSPLRTTAPLYRFELDEFEPGSGRFIESPACSKLIEELDGVFQDAQSPTELDRARKWIEKALVQQPGFLEGGLCLARIQYLTGGTNLRPSLTTIEHFIKQAESLIPRGYRGKLPWGWISNRFYHRMLWLQMTIYHDAGWMRECLKGARKMLRLNPSDNLGVRHYYPLMLLEVGECEKALKAARFPKEAECQQALIRAFCFFAVGNRPAFLQALTTALFEVPILRLFLLDDFDGELPDGDEGFRGVIPDMETFTQFAWPAYQAVPGLQQACTDYLSNPLVQQAEGRLREYWKGYWRRGSEAVGDHYGWEALKRQLREAIQQQLAFH